MRICAVIKYPPIQGGVSAQGYWMARGLAKRGHTVEVVTNAMEVEDAYRLRLTEEDLPWLTPRFPGGGEVRLHAPEVFSPKLAHIPQANPFVSKLAGLATDVIRRHGSEALFSYYLEPNGVAAHLAAAWTGRPHLVQHAGSDLGRLMKQPGLDVAYQEVFRRAAGICTGSPYTFLGMGAAPESLYRHPPFYLPRRYFSPAAEPLDLDAHVAAVAARHPGAVHQPGAIDPAVPTVGVYGKLGEAKGSFDLLAALGVLRREGRRFNFVAVTGGRELPRYLETLRREGLEGCSWVLPFMAHWRVPGFLRACDAVCFLERDFPISFHAPTIPREILACGTCLVLSGEIRAKQPRRELMVDGENFLLIDDPKRIEDLAAVLRRVIADPPAARRIGARGHEALAETHDSDRQAEAYEEMFLDLLERAAGGSGRFTPAERGLAADRAESLRRLAAPLVAALGDEADPAIGRYLADHPAPPAGPHADARAFCTWAAPAAAAGGEEDPERLRVVEAARYSDHLLWMTCLDGDRGAGEAAGHGANGSRSGEPAPPRFDRPDRLPELGGGSWRPEVVRALAPLATRWLRVDRFVTAPAEAPLRAARRAGAGPPADEPAPAGPGDDAPAVDGEQILVFHKLPSLTGHHFEINGFTAELLAACDGRRSVEELIAGYGAASGRPPAEVAAAIGAVLRRFYREGLIVLVEPAAGG